MHDTAYRHGQFFYEAYWNPRFTDVIELGSQNVNGSLRDHCPPEARYIGLDMAPGNGVDLVVEPGKNLPLADGSCDVAVTSSAFEHDACFWQTFLELSRVLRPGGLVYINAPSNYAFHRYPLDCWRFYPDAGIALARWAQRSGFDIRLIESFIAAPQGGGWADFVAVFHKQPDPSFQRRGTIAARSEAMNVFDIDANDVELGNRKNETWDMLDQMRTADELQEARQKIEQLQREAAALEAELADLKAAITRQGRV